MGTVRRWAWYIGAAFGWTAIEVGLSSWLPLSSSLSDLAMRAIAGAVLAATAALVTSACMRFGAPTGIAHAVAASCIAIGIFIVLVSWTPIEARTMALQFTTLGTQLLALTVAPAFAAYSASHLLGHQSPRGDETPLASGSA